jgi:hypothetical protein
MLIVYFIFEQLAQLGSKSTKPCFLQAAEYPCDAHVVVEGSLKGFIVPFFVVGHSRPR